MQKPAGVHALVRRTHEEHILGTLREHGALSRSELAQRVQLSRTTLSEIVNNLLARGAIVVVNTDADRREGSGRPAECLVIDPASGQFMGIDFGHARVRIAVADASHDILASGVTRYDLDTDWPERIAHAIALIERLSAEIGVHYGALQGVGVGLAGPFLAPLTGLGSNAGSRSRAVSLVTDALSERFNAPIIINNNSRMAALAEAIWAGDGNVQDLLYLRLAEGVGGGLVVGGRLVAGSSGLAGELGHVAVSAKGVECRCGKRDCLETVASVPAVLQACRERGATVHTLDDLAAAIAKNDPIVDAVLREVGTAIGRVLGAAAMTLNPAEIVIGGELARIAPVILQQVASSIRYELIAVGVSPIIRIAHLSDDDGALGALAALFHESPLLASYQELAVHASAEPTPVRSTI